MRLVGGFVNISTITNSRGENVASSLLALHALTGCVTIGMFAGIGKGTWMKRFMLAKKRENFLAVMSTFEYGVTEAILTTFLSFICSVYRHTRITINLPEGKFDLSTI